MTALSVRCYYKRMKKSIFAVLVGLVLAGTGAAAAQAQLYTAPGYYLQSSYCPSLSYNLYRGLYDYQTGGQVTQLQQFLNARYGGQLVTGYFGAITAANVAHFQQEQAVYPITGGVGPLTRAAIARVCGSGYPYPTPTPTQQISITSVSGPNALAAGQSGTWTVLTNAAYGSSVTMSVRWGDENTYPYALGASAASNYVGQQNTFSHTYNQAGTYTITFTASDSYGRTTSASASVAVSGGSSGCNAYPYWYPCPTTQAPTISSISPVQGPIGTQVTIYGSGFTQDNRVHFGGGGAIHVPSYSNGTMLYYTIPSSVGPCNWVGDTSPVHCLVADAQVTLGQYQISVDNENGQSGSATFTVTGGSQSGAFSANPSSGYAPLTVTFTSNTSGTVTFGDGASAQLNANCLTGLSGSQNCSTGNYFVAHTYASRGSYTATLWTSYCPPGAYCIQASQQAGTVAITVY